MVGRGQLHSIWAKGWSLLSLATLLVILLLTVPSRGGEMGGQVGTGVGDLAPDFSLPDLRGQQICLSAFRGKRVILNFWSTWCKPCVQEMPAMEAFYQKSRSAGIEILAVSINTERDSTVKRFAERLNLSFPILLDRDKTVARKYKVFALPTTYLINQEGIIEGKWFGKIQLDAAIFQSGLKEAAVPAP